MSKEKTDRAFPTSSSLYGGLTQRQWFAGQALIGHLSGRQYLLNGDHRMSVDVIAKRCFEIADAMMKADEQ